MDEQLTSSFAELLGRQPTEAEQKRLYQVKNALNIHNNDALWLILMALESYNTLYEQYPARIARDVERLVNRQQAVLKSMALTETKKAHADLSAAVVEADLARGGGYVVEDDGAVVAYFAFLPSPEPTYAAIEGGAWLDDTASYHVVHRIGSYPHVHGIFDAILDWCFEQEPNIRIDTHRDNRIMQHLIARYGFSYCGIIHLASGAERLAYQKIKLT